VLRSSDGTPSYRVLVDAPRDRVLSALSAAYSELGIEMKVYDSGSGQVGNRNLVKSSRLAGERLSRFLRCGTVIGGDAADNYRVTMSIISQATPSEGGTTVETWLTASARDHGTSSGGVACATTGSLEDRINRLVLAWVADKPAG